MTDQNEIAEGSVQHVRDTNNVSADNSKMLAGKDDAPTPKKVTNSDQKFDVDTHVKDEDDVGEDNAKITANAGKVPKPVKHVNENSSDDIDEDQKNVVSTDGSDDDIEPKDKKKKKVTKEDVDFTEYHSALFNGTELTEEYQSKAKILFETAVLAAANELVETNESERKEFYDNKYNELVTSLTEAHEKEITSLVEKLDEDISNVADEWIVENKIAVESNIRTEISESFMNDLKDVFSKHYIDLPESKVDVVKELSDAKSSLEEEVNQLTDQLMTQKSVTKKIIRESLKRNTQDSR